MLLPLRYAICEKVYGHGVLRLSGLDTGNDEFIADCQICGKVFITNREGVRKLLTNHRVAIEKKEDPDKDVT